MSIKSKYKLFYKKLELSGYTYIYNKIMLYIYSHIMTTPVFVVII